MVLILDTEICIPLNENQGVPIKPAFIGPVLLSLMASRFLFAQIIAEVQPPGFDSDYADHFTQFIRADSGDFLHIVEGVIRTVLYNGVSQSRADSFQGDELFLISVI